MRENPDALCYHEGRVKADSELADQAGVLLSALAESLQKGLRTRMCDRAEVLDQFHPRHPNAEILYGQGLGLVVRRDVDFQREVVVKDLLFRKLDVAELLQRIGGVGDQLTDEDLLFRIKRMNDDIQHLLDFGLELEGFWRGGRHGKGTD